ncbi:MAG: hypothetical protein KAS71_05270 [Bacteroidales bacterium]|nr:hypothetical protein [Bacteroidales bacterium]
MLKSEKFLHATRYIMLIGFIFPILGLSAEGNNPESAYLAQDENYPVVFINDQITATGDYFFNVRTFGATGDGVTDDSEAIQQALTSAGQTTNGVVYLPEGTYLMNKRAIWERLSGDRVHAGLAIRGDGAGKTVVLVDNAEGGFLMNDFYSLTQFQIRDITFLAVRPSAGTAIKVGKFGNRSGGRSYRCFFGENIEIRGQEPADYFTIGLDINTVYRPMYRNVIFTGATQPGDEYLADAGIMADWCYSTEVEGCVVRNAKRGFTHISDPEIDKGAPEGGTFHNCIVDNCMIGIDIDNPGVEPGLAISYNSLKTRDVGLRISKKKFHQIRNNIFEPVLDPAVHAYKDIQTKTCFEGVIHQNIFKRFAGTSSMEEGRTCISFDDQDWRHDNKEMIIMNNVFPGVGTALGGAQVADVQATSIIKDNMDADTMKAGSLRKLLDEHYFQPLHPLEKEISGPVFSIVDYGAKGSDWTDDTDAIQAAVDDLAANGGGILYIPAGEFLVSKKIQLHLPAKTSPGTIAIIGEGPGVSQVICDNQDGVFSITDSSGTAAFYLRNFGMYANKMADTAIFMESLGESLPNYRTLKVTNLDIEPYDATFDLHYHFGNGLMAKGFQSPFFHSFIFSSYSDPNYDEPLNDIVTYGLYLEDCDQVSMTYSYSKKAKYSYYFKGEKLNQSYFFRVRGVNGKHSFYFDLRKPSYGLWMESCHANKTLTNFYIKNMHDFVLIDNLPYGPADENALNDIELVNCSNGMLTGIVYQAPVPDNGQPLPESNRTAVVIRGKSSDITIEKSIFIAKGKVLAIERDLEGIIVRDNLYPNPMVDKTIEYLEDKED